METAQLRKQLLACLDDYLGQTGEAALSRAYELGRLALAQKLGVLESSGAWSRQPRPSSPNAFPPSK